jgi:octaprenyl-diphosphate synthase
MQCVIQSNEYVNKNLENVSRKLKQVAFQPVTDAILTVTKSISESNFQLDPETWFSNITKLSNDSQVAGKKFRARASIAVSALLELDDNTATTLGTFVELVQTASLVHDDVLDDASIRRGSKTVNCIQGNRFAVLTGDYIIGQALSELASLGSKDVVSLFSRVISQMTLGEAMEIECTFATNRTIEHYLATLSLKTASLMSFCTHSPCLVTGKDPATTEALSNFGLNLGMAFQLADDVLDFTGNDGKKTGKDFEQGIMTYPMILLPKDENFWKLDFDKVKEKATIAGSISKATQLARHYCHLAKKNLEDIPNYDKNDGCQLLASIADSVTEKLPS